MSRCGASALSATEGCRRSAHALSWVSRQEIAARVCQEENLSRHTAGRTPDKLELR